MASDTEAMGLAFVGQLVTTALIARLEANGFLSKDDVGAIHEMALAGLEAYPHNLPFIGVARKIVDQMAAIAAKHPTGAQET